MADRASKHLPTETVRRLLRGQPLAPGMTRKALLAIGRYGDLELLEILETSDQRERVRRRAKQAASEPEMHEATARAYRECREHASRDQIAQRAGEILQDAGLAALQSELRALAARSMRIKHHRQKRLNRKKEQ